jgi:molybdate transport system substrate-binding protein
MIFPLALVGPLNSASAPDQTISVFAAASLKDAFTGIARQYEASHSGTHITLNFAGSQTLAAQITQGAPADIFASASIKNLEDSHPKQDSIRIFVHNHLTIVVRKELAGVKAPRELASVQKLVLADVTVPAGKYAEEFLNVASKKYGKPWLNSVMSHVVSRELDVRAVLTKVRLGEADAGIVYVSDAVSAKGEVREVPIPDPLNQLAKYPVAVTSHPANPDGAKEFIKFLFQAESQKTLQANGFISPLQPVSSFVFASEGSTKAIKLPLSAAYGKATIEVIGHAGKTEKVAGVPVLAVLKGLKGSVTFIGADEYSRTIDASSFNKAVFAREADGNYQIVVAGLKPSSWVRWIRRIESK